MNKREKIVQQAFLDNEEAIIKRLKSLYSHALTDIEKKAQSMQDEINRLGIMAKLSVDDEEKAKLLSMQQSKIYQKQYQDALKKQIGSILDNMQVEEFKSVSSYLNKCYEEGFLGTMYNLQGQGIPLCFPLDQEAMVRAVQLDSKISNGLYSRLGEDIAMLKKKITAEVSRGIATGASFQQVAAQLKARTNIGYNNAVRIARTEGHRIQVQSTMDACYKAQEKGCNIVKQWDAALDSRTRESHVAVDGEIRELDEKFSNGLMYPGDPSGGAAEVVNCRCALLQRARKALPDEEFTKMNGETGELVNFKDIDDYNEFKKNYTKTADDLTNNVNSDKIESEKNKHIFAEGKNLVGEIDYENSGFDHDIQTAVHAQGFDGVPQVVEYEEFKDAMQKSNFYAERTYGAPDQATLDLYQKQLYEDEWYIDCSTGGAQYGQGMYCAACYDLKDNKSLGGIGWEMAQYQDIAINQRGNTCYVTEGITLQPNAKIFKLPYGKKAGEYISDEYSYSFMRKYATSEQKPTVEKLINVRTKINNLTWKEPRDYIDALYNEADSYYNQLTELSKAATKAMQYTPPGSKYAKFKNPGTLAVEMGYDAINAEGHGQSGSYTVILNRTKLIFCKGGSIYGN